MSASPSRPHPRARARRRPRSRPERRTLTRPSPSRGWQAGRRHGVHVRNPDAEAPGARPRARRVRGRTPRSPVRLAGLRGGRPGDRPFRYAGRVSRRTPGSWPSFRPTRAPDVHPEMPAGLRAEARGDRTAHGARGQPRTTRAAPQALRTRPRQRDVRHQHRGRLAAGRAQPDHRGGRPPLGSACLRLLGLAPTDHGERSSSAPGSCSGSRCRTITSAGLRRDRWSSGAARPRPRRSEPPCVRPGLPRPTGPRALRTRPGQHSE